MADPFRGPTLGETTRELRALDRVIRRWRWFVVDKASLPQDADGFLRLVAGATRRRTEDGAEAWRLRSRTLHIDLGLRVAREGHTATIVALTARMYFQERKRRNRS